MSASIAIAGLGIACEQTSLLPGFSMKSIHPRPTIGTQEQFRFGPIALPLVEGSNTLSMDLGSNTSSLRIKMFRPIGVCVNAVSLGQPAKGFRNFVVGYFNVVGACAGRNASCQGENPNGAPNSNYLLDFLGRGETSLNRRLRHVNDQCILQGNEFLDQGGAGGSPGGSSGKSGGGGGDSGSSDHSFQPSEGGKADFLILIATFFRRNARVEGRKFAVFLLFAQWFLYRNSTASADSTASPHKSALTRRENTTEIEPDSQEGVLDAVFEVRGGQWRRLFIDSDKDEFVIKFVNKNEGEAQFSGPESTSNESKGQEAAKSRQDWRLEALLGGVERSVNLCWNVTRKLMLPEGYPKSVSGDYLEYTLWRMGQGIASQINGVLTTQALLYAVGLGKGAIPTAAAVNWVLKDGIGYLSKILLSKYGRHFDVHPKGWRLLADLMENASYGLELLTPMCPHLFVYLGAAAGAGRSAAGLIQAATRSCFYAGFAAQRNFAEVIAKGEAQGMVSKSLGIMLGIAISGYVGSSGPILVATFTAVTGAHMLCNLRSYQAVQLRTLNPYRANLVFGEYIRSGIVASIKEVNAEEPIFTEVPFLMFKLKGAKENCDVLSSQTKEDAAVLANKLNLGVTFGNLVKNKQEADALFKIYQNEQYILAERQNQFQVLLKEGATSHDLLRMMLQVSYLYQLQTQSGNISNGIVADCEEFGCLKISHKFVVENFGQVQQDLASAGWVTSDGLVSRPSSFRLLDDHSLNTSSL